MQKWGRWCAARTSKVDAHPQSDHTKEESNGRLTPSSLGRRTHVTKPMSSAHRPRRSATTCILTNSQLVYSVHLAMASSGCLRAKEPQQSKQGWHLSHSRTHRVSTSTSACRDKGARPASCQSKFIPFQQPPQPVLQSIQCSYPYWSTTDQQDKTR